MESNWTNENLQAFIYALKGELEKKGTPCRVEYFNHHEKGNGKYKDIIGVAIITNQGTQRFEIWETNKADNMYWDYYRDNSFHSFSMRG